MNLSDVSKTAIVTLRSRVIESEKIRHMIADPMARFCLDKILSLASGQDHEQILKRKLSSVLTLHIALRARKYDSIVNRYITENPGCIVINLGCGFDTRYWRINNRDCEYIELDLPEVIELKKDILGEKLCYELLGISVLDTSWIDLITKKSVRNILLAAEGLFMYLEKKDVIDLFRVFATRFFRSQMVLEVVTEKYTRGFWKRMAEIKMNRELGLKAGSSYNFGIKDAHELETFADGIKVIDEWSYFEDPDIRPLILKYLGLPRTQWTVTATIN